jgi:ankyrin repeat protein
MRLRKVLLVLGLVLAARGAHADGDFNGWYTPALAASRNDTALTEQLMLAGGQDPDGLDSKSGRTALGYAASFDNVALAQFMLDHGAHIDARDGTGNTALHAAAERGSIAMMRLLIAHKATVDTADRQGVTPLMVAAGHTQPQAVRLLIESGADPHKQDFTGRDAFGWAAGRSNVLQALNEKR